MKIRASIIYDDGIEVILSIEEESLPFFAEALNSRSAFWDSNNEGFWTDITKVRYVKFQKVTPFTDIGEKCLPSQ